MVMLHGVASASGMKLTIKIFTMNLLAVKGVSPFVWLTRARTSIQQLA